MKTIAVPTGMLGAIAWFPLLGAAIALQPVLDFPSTAYALLGGLGLLLIAQRVDGTVRGWRAIVTMFVLAGVLVTCKLLWDQALATNDAAKTLPSFIVAIVSGIVMSVWITLSARRSRGTDKRPDRR